MSYYSQTTNCTLAAHSELVVSTQGKRRRASARAGQSCLLSPCPFSPSEEGVAVAGFWRPCHLEQLLCQQQGPPSYDGGRSKSRKPQQQWPAVGLSRYLTDLQLPQLSTPVAITKPQLQLRYSTPKVPEHQFHHWHPLKTD